MKAVYVLLVAFALAGCASSPQAKIEEARIQGIHRTMLEVAQFEWPQIERRFAAQDGFGALALVGGDECHRWLRAQTDVTGPAVGCQPEIDLCTGGRVSPMSGQYETLLKLSQTSTFYRASSPRAILPP